MHVAETRKGFSDLLDNGLDDVIMVDFEWLETIKCISTTEYKSIVSCDTIIVEYHLCIPAHTIAQWHDVMDLLGGQWLGDGDIVHDTIGIGCFVFVEIMVGLAYASD
jgi:hypothetical protein